MTLNIKHRNNIIISAVIFILMGLFPPWTYTIDAESVHSMKPAGYAFIALPPNPEGDAPAYGVKIDFSRLFIQWLILAATTSLVIFMSNTRKNK